MGSKVFDVFAIIVSEPSSDWKIWFLGQKNMCDENECEQLIAILKAFHEINPKIAEVDYDKVLSLSLIHILHDGTAVSVTESLTQIEIEIVNKIGIVHNNLNFDG